MIPSNVLNKSLEELEGSDWGEPKYDSNLVRSVHRLRRVPLREFSTEDLRLMIGQNVGLHHLVPFALERLQEDPLTHGDFYLGDLLTATLRADQKFWREHPEWRAKLRDLTERTIENLRGRSHKKEKKFRSTLEALTDALDAFDASASLI